MTDTKKMVDYGETEVLNFYRAIGRMMSGMTYHNQKFDDRTGASTAARSVLGYVANNKELCLKIFPFLENNAPPEVSRLWEKAKKGNSKSS